MDFIIQIVIYGYFEMHTGSNSAKTYAGSHGYLMSCASSPISQSTTPPLYLPSKTQPKQPLWEFLHQNPMGHPNKGKEKGFPFCELQSSLSHGERETLRRRMREDETSTVMKLKKCFFFANCPMLSLIVPLLS